MNWNHFKINICSEKCAWVSIDKKDKSANAICPELLAELDAVISYLESAADLKKVVFQSAKKGSFIVGADLEAFAQMGQGLEGEQFIAKGQEVFARLENLKIPTIALIEGYCFGGGFEFALACHYRIAVESKTTKMGFPEVKLGIQPGWGGTVRSMRLNSPSQTFPLILTGKTLSEKAAKKLQLVDQVIAPRLVQQALASITKKKTRTPSWQSKVQNFFPIRQLVKKYLLKELEKKKVQPEHYPAPQTMIQTWAQSGHMDKSAYAAELDSIIKLMKTPTARNLVKVFFLGENLKKQIPKDLEKITHVHVIGSGVMGGDIALWSAHKGLKVTVQDLNPQAYTSMVQRLKKFADRRYKNKAKRDGFLDKIICDPQGYGLESCDLVIEAVSENLDLKKKILKDVEQRTRPETIIATNTSTIPLEKIDDIFEKPDRFIGVHFFNPVPKMPLVEIVIGQKTSEQTTQKCLRYVGQIDKYPLKVKSAPGFLVNRILLPYMLEAIKLHQEGMSLEVIDLAAEKFGMPMGPVELADKVGLDVTIAALTSIRGEEHVPTIVQKKVKAGQLGCKSGEGFYSYKKGKPQKNIPSDTHKLHEAQLRLILCLCNESVSAWREGIVESVEDLDAGSIYGFGFPPFRGGVMTYLKEQGIGDIRDKLSAHHEKFGERFTPDQGFEALAVELAS